MKRLRYFIFFSSVAVLMSACTQNFVHDIELNDNGVVVHKDSLDIEIEVVDDAIIHVKKHVKGAAIDELPNYVAILEPQNVEWEMSQTEKLLTISTSQLNVLVHDDGTISYTDKDNKILVAETNDMSYIQPNEKGKNEVSQAFIAGDEALYGLGQFQSGIMNWKNVPMRLQQYNQEIAIPFLNSTNGYGIYWNNYSLTDFNRPQHEIEFNSTVEIDSTQIKKTPVDGEKENVAAYTTDENLKNNSRETTFTPTKTGNYTFLALSDNSGRMKGEIKVTIDGDDIIHYETIWMPRRYSGKKYLEAGKSYKVVFQNKGAKIPGNLYYNEPDFNKSVFTSTIGDGIDYYFVHGENPAEIIATYQNLTGKAPMFAKSAYGFWQCRERYHNQEELLENARMMREKQIPFDNIVQDWFYWPKGTKGPEWDPAKYPDPDAMVATLDSMHINLMVSVWPEVRNAALVERYQLKKIPESQYIDIYDKGTGERFYRMLSDSMFHKGVKSIWLDGTEPEGVPDPTQLTAVGPFENVQNTYSLEVTKVMYEGRRQEFPDERVFNLTRSAYAGQQRYGAASWSGDVEASWEQFSEQIAAGLNFTMAGIPYWTHDIGGFFRDSRSINPEFKDQYTDPEYIELLTRWFQFGTFSPIFRIHGYVSETEIWRYGSDFEATARTFIDLRYQLMPYIYSEAWKVTNDSHLLMSPLAYYYPKDKNTWGIKNQLFFGESIMVGFVTKYQDRSMEMYMPEGDWFDFWNNNKIKGGQSIKVDAPLNQTPLFVKAGSIIPIGPKVQYATQKTEEPITIKVYPGKDAEYVLYLDDGTSYDYEEGDYSEIMFSYSEDDNTLKLEKGNGDFRDFSETPMEFIIQVVGTEKLMNTTFTGEEINIELK